MKVIKGPLAIEDAARSAELEQLESLVGRLLTPVEIEAVSGGCSSPDGHCQGSGSYSRDSNCPTYDQQGGTGPFTQTGCTITPH